MRFYARKVKKITDDSYLKFSSNVQASALFLKHTHESSVIDPGLAFYKTNGVILQLSEHFYND